VADFPVNRQAFLEVSFVLLPLSPQTGSKGQGSERPSNLSPGTDLPKLDIGENRINNIKKDRSSTA
jgi:hypothetical protein